LSVPPCLTRTGWISLGPANTRQSSGHDPRDMTVLGVQVDSSVVPLPTELITAVSCWHWLPSLADVGQPWSSSDALGTPRRPGDALILGCSRLLAPVGGDLAANRWSVPGHLGQRSASRPLRPELLAGRSSTVGTEVRGPVSVRSGRSARAGTAAVLDCCTAAVTAGPGGSGCRDRAGRCRRLEAPPAGRAREAPERVSRRPRSVRRRRPGPCRTPGWWRS
jgi:hypothetical protein